MKHYEIEIVQFSFHFVFFFGLFYLFNGTSTPYGSFNVNI